MALAGQILAWAGVVLILSALVWYGSSPVRVLSLLPAEQVIGLKKLNDLTWLMALLVIYVSYGVVIWCFVELSRLFGAIRHGDIFGERLERALRRLGIAALVSAFGAIVQRTLTTLILTYTAPPGQRHLTVSISTDDVIFALIAIFLFLFSVIVREARRADVENQGFV